MLKYAKIPGFRNSGEVYPHLYQWVEDVSKLRIQPEIIFISAYDKEPIMYKGYIDTVAKTYLPVEPTIEEMKEVYEIIGEVKNIKDFNEFNKIIQILDFELKLNPLYGKKDF